MKRRPPRSTGTDTLFPYTTLFRSRVRLFLAAVDRGQFGRAQFERPAHLPYIGERHLRGVDRMAHRRRHHRSVDRSNARLAAVAVVNDAQHGERPERLAHHRTVDAHLSRKATLPRTRVTDPQVVAADIIAQRSERAVYERSADV